MHRRDFVKTSAAAAVGGISLSSRPLPLSAQEPTADAIRVGVVGCGGRGTGAVVQALSTTQDVKLVAMADAFADRVEGSYRTITTLEEMDLNPRVDCPRSTASPASTPTSR